MKRLITLTFQYYRILLFNNILFSIMCGVLFRLGLCAFDTGILLFSKFIGLVCAIAYYHYMYHNSYYYFRNSGLNIRRLLIYSFVIDLVVTIILITIKTLVSYALKG